MRWAIVAELGAALVLWLIFVGMYVSRHQWSAGPVGRQMLVASIAAAGEAGALLLLGLGVPVPPLVFLVGFGLTDLVVARWVWLLWLARREHPHWPRKTP